METLPLSVVMCLLLVHYGHGLPIYDTIVVGMGAAGTASASALARAGRKVLALEAQGRLGGRVVTLYFKDGVVELGAEWIHGTGKSSTYQLAVQNNITILEQNFTSGVYFSDGSSDRADVVRDVAEFALKAMNEPPDVPDSLGHYVTKRVTEYIKNQHPSVANDTAFIQSVLEFLETLILTHEAADTWNDVTTHSSYEALSGSQAMSWHSYGYYTLFQIMLNTYKNGPGYPSLEIKMNTEVTQIQWPQDPKANVIVTVKDGSTYTAKNLIVTVSVGVLKERHQSLFSPGLPPQKVRAIESISIGVCAKIIFFFESPWWNETLAFLLWKPEDKKTVEEPWLLRVNTPGTPMSYKKAMTVWACGEAAKTVESLPNDVVGPKVMGLLRRFLGKGKTIPDPVRMIKSDWFSNPFTRGTYTYDNIDSPNNPTARMDLAAPLVDSSGIPRVLFAGEATEVMEFGTVHGAVDSGLREANRILSL